MQFSLEKAFEIGHKFKNDGNYFKAKDVFDSILTTFPNHAKANFDLGLLYQLLSLFDEAKYYFKKSLNIEPKNLENWNIYLTALIDDKQFDECKEELTRAKSVFKNNCLFENIDKQLDRNNLNLKEFNTLKSKNINENLKKTLKYDFEKGNYPELLSNINKLSKEYSDSSFLMYLKGNIFKKLKFFDYAIDCFNKGLNINSKDIKNPFDLGFIYLERNCFSEAIDCFKKINQLDPNNTDAINSLGNVHYAQKKFQNALNYYKKAAELDPSNLNFKINIFKVYEETNEFLKALKIFQEISMNRREYYVEIKKCGITFKKFI